MSARKPPAKFIQIVATRSRVSTLHGVYSEPVNEPILHALDEDGQVWRWNYGCAEWRRMPMERES